MAVKLLFGETGYNFHLTFHSALLVRRNARQAQVMGILAREFLKIQLTPMSSFVELLKNTVPV